jgi:tRNA 2-thiouridine synthesizing protein A
MSAEILVDARGMLCPWPVVRLSRAAREAGGAARIRILADDPAAAGEIAQLCAQRQWSFAADPSRPEEFTIGIC